MKTQEQAMKIIRAHGLYCVALTNSGAIGLTDNAGNVYDVIIWDGKNVLDGTDAMNLAAWLGY